MAVADEVAEWLAEKGITHAFGVIGGGNLSLWDAIARLQKTSIVCVHHEQAAVMAAAYYYRVSGRMAVALVTTGAGSTNAITGVMAAWMDRIPLMVISGNEASKYMWKPTRVWGVQGYDSSGMASNCTKLSLRPEREEVIDALTISHAKAVEAPQGPVWIDIPKDIQGAAL